MDILTLISGVSALNYKSLPMQPSLRFFLRSSIDIVLEPLLIILYGPKPLDTKSLLPTGEPNTTIHRGTTTDTRDQRFMVSSALMNYLVS